MPELKTVVYVEPLADGESTVPAALQDAGWDVVRATNVAAGFQQAKRIKPALLVTRGDIPGGGSLALVKQLRGCAHTALLPVVAVLPAGSGDRAELGRWGVGGVLDAKATDDDIVAAARAHAAKPPAVTQAPDDVLGRPARLQALVRTGLLDTPPEEVFDRVAQLAARLLDVPVVLLSLVDRHRQFFKAQVGVPEPVATARETPLTHSFCQWVVSEQEDLVVSDARKHDLLKANGSTVDMGVVAYAGVPLHADGKETIGSFCAIDMKPRDWDARELRALHDAAKVVEALTMLRQAAHFAPMTLEEFRATCAVVGQGVQAAVRLQATGTDRMTSQDRHGVLELTADLGKQLCQISTGARTL